MAAGSAYGGVRTFAWVTERSSECACWPPACPQPHGRKLLPPARRWPLHAASANNHLSVARLLVERGADVDKLDAVSEPALWHAVEQGHGPMVELLLELGATASDLPAPPGKVGACLPTPGLRCFHAEGLLGAGRWALHWTCGGHCKADSTSRVSCAAPADQGGLCSAVPCGGERVPAHGAAAARQGRQPLHL